MDLNKARTWRCLDQIQTRLENDMSDFHSRCVQVCMVFPRTIALGNLYRNRYIFVCIYIYIYTCTYKRIVHNVSLTKVKVSYVKCIDLNLLCYRRKRDVPEKWAFYPSRRHWYMTVIMTCKQGVFFSGRRNPICHFGLVISKLDAGIYGRAYRQNIYCVCNVCFVDIFSFSYYICLSLALSLEWELQLKYI